MKASHQPIAPPDRFECLQWVEDLWDEFAAEHGIEARPEALDELERRVHGVAQSRPRQTKRSRFNQTAPHSPR